MPVPLQTVRSQSSGTWSVASAQQIKVLADSQPVEERTPTKPSEVGKNQMALDVGGLLIHSLSYARRVGDTNLSVGGGLGFASALNSHTFLRNIFYPFHAVVFGRYQPSQVLQLDFGPTLLWYSWTDDCPECTGTFVGLHLAAVAGYKNVFVGPWLRIGLASYRRHWSEFGAIWGLQVRLFRPWGR